MPAFDLEVAPGCRPEERAYLPTSRDLLGSFPRRHIHPARNLGTRRDAAAAFVLMAQAWAPRHFAGQHRLIVPLPLVRLRPRVPYDMPAAAVLSTSLPSGRRMALMVFRDRSALLAREILAPETAPAGDVPDTAPETPFEILPAILSLHSPPRGSVAHGYTLRTPLGRTRLRTALVLARPRMASRVEIHIDPTRKTQTPSTFDDGVSTGCLCAFSPRPDTRRALEELARGWLSEVQHDIRALDGLFDTAPLLHVDAPCTPVPLRDLTAADILSMTLPEGRDTTSARVFWPVFAPRPVPAYVRAPWTAWARWLGLMTCAQGYRAADVHVDAPAPSTDAWSPTICLRAARPDEGFREIPVASVLPDWQETIKGLPTWWGLRALLDTRQAGPETTRITGRVHVFAGSAHEVLDTQAHLDEMRRHP